MESTTSTTELTAVFARIQGMLPSQETAQAAAAQLAQAARDLIDTAAGAGLSLIDETGKRTTTTATDALVETAADTRWPDWSRAAAGAGIASILSAPVLYRDKCLGAMKIYATTTNAFSTRAEHHLVPLASAAGTLLGAAQGSDAPHRLSAAMRQALADRSAVETATRMLMERHTTGQETARRRLITASQEQNRPLAQLARRIVERTTDASL